jgi:chromosome segregation ATPase
MVFFGLQSRQQKEVIGIIENIAKNLGIETSVVYHFLIRDLEKTIHDKIEVHQLRLSAVQSDFVDLQKKEEHLNQEIRRLEIQIQDTNNEIVKLESSLTEKANILATKTQAITELRNRLNSLIANIQDNEKEIKLLDYKVMMKNHSFKSKTDLGFKKIHILLIVFTIAAMIIALILILKRK